MNNKNNMAAAAILALLAFGPAANAAEITGALNVGVGSSDNLQRTPDNQIDVGIAFVGAEFGYNEVGRKLSANIIVNADYLFYDDNSIDEELLGGGSAFIDYVFVDESFWWNLQYNYGQQVFDPLTPIRPGNVENVGFLTTGPVLELPFGDRNSLDIEVGVSTVRYEIRANDNDRTNAQVGVSRDIGSGRTIALIVDGERVEFDDAVLNPDFERREMFFRWTDSTTRNSITVDVGYSELELDGAPESSDGSVFRFDWERIVSPSATFTVGGGSRFSDQGDIFRFQQNTLFDVRETEDVLGVATPFRSNFFNSTYSIDKERWGLDFLVNWSEEDYEDTDVLDRELTRVNLFLNRQLSRKFFGEFGIIYSSRDFQGLNRKDDDTLYEVSLGYQINPAFSSTLSYQYLKRTSTLEIDEFDENRIFLTFSYVPKWFR